MATSVATPLERRLGMIAGVNEMTSSSSATARTRISLQFDLNRNIDGAAREVQAAINAVARRPAGHAAQQPDLPQGQPVGRAGDHPGADLEDALAGPDLRRGVQHRAASGSRRSQGVGDVEIGGGSLPAVRVELLPFALNQLRHQQRGRARRDPGEQRQPAEGHDRGRRAGGCRSTRQTAGAAARPTTAAWSSPGATARRSASTTSPRSIDGVENIAHARPVQRRAGGDRAGHAPAGRQRHRDRRRRARAAARAAARSCRHGHQARRSPPTAPTRSAPRCARSRSRC